MWSDFPLFPEQASTMAGRVDALYLALLALAAFFSVLIACLVVGFAIKFRRRSPGEIGTPIHGNFTLEAVWTGVPLVIVTVICMAVGRYV